MDELQVLQRILENIINAANALQQSGEVLPDEVMQSAASFLNDVLSRINELQGNAPSISSPQNPEIPSGEFPSSNVNGFKYNPQNQEMFVQFHGPYPQAAGAVYKYSNVPKYIFDIIERGAVGPKTSGENRYHAWQRGITPSLGASVNGLLKAGGFQYQRMS